MRYEFEPTAPLTVAATLRSSDLNLTASESAATAVVEVEPRRGSDELAAQTRVEMIGSRLEIVVPKIGGSFLRPGGSVVVTVTVPVGTSLEAEAGSGDVRTTGPLAAVDVRGGSGDLVISSAEDLRVAAGSGDVTVESAGAASITTGSGDIRLGRSSATAELRAGSGDITVEDAADVRLVTGSGDAVIGRSDGAVTLATGSGDLVLRSASGGEVQARSASGDVLVGVAPGTAALLDCSSVSGRVSSDLEAGDAPGDDERGVVLRLRSVSGDIRVHRA